ncbi:MAG: hypothetical protein O2901_15460 [Verrucomicrobia bacterium]|nr:hypothetical protein [Verrucomicrobiota bacterium]
MKRSVLFMVLLSTMALLWPSWAGEEETDPHPRVELDLTDGSHVIGNAAIESLPFQTSYAKLDIPLTQILTMRLNADHETAVLVLRNGDTLNGVVSLERINLETIFGGVAVDIKYMRELRVILSDGALPDALKQGLVLHYSFDRDEGGTVTDESERGNHGSIQDACLVEDGRYRRALTLDGENDHVRVPNNESLEIRSALTLCTWVKLKSFGPGGYGNEHGYIINKGNGLWWNPTFYLGYTKQSGSGQPRWPAKPGPFPAMFHVGNSTGARSEHDGGARRRNTIRRANVHATVHRTLNLLSRAVVPRNRLANARTARIEL